MCESKNKLRFSTPCHYLTIGQISKFLLKKTASGLLLNRTGAGKWQKEIVVVQKVEVTAVDEAHQVIRDQEETGQAQQAENQEVVVAMPRREAVSSPNP
ncbi:hypothetical protein P4B35_20835 [Pontiellaceae bacterium B12227]|nr:hypothetical protein [Pontiellaceae bacterium B12227]